MAIKVVGQQHPSAVKRVVCKNCGAELEYTLADTHTETHRDYGGGSDTYRILQCPPCGNKINLGYSY
jgi:RNase P subunit RPR2